MDSSQIGLIIVLLVLIILSSLFSASETAITSINTIRIKQLAKSGNKRAQFIFECSEKVTRCITSILIANNIVNILASAITTALFTTLFGVYGVAYATIVMTILILVFGEITPKIIANHHSEKVALNLAPIIKGVLFVCHPIAVLVESVQHKYLSVNDTVTATEDELLEIVSTIEQEGVLEQEERELIENVIEFNDTIIKDIMVKKENVVYIYENTSFSQLKKIMKTEQFSRLPVLSKEGQVIGILNGKDLFEYLLDNKPIVIREIMTKPLFVSKRKKLPEVLESIQKSREHIAIVVENLKSKQFVGIITLEDILEELVGEIYDEHDLLPKDVVEVGNHTFIVAADVSLKEFFEKYDEIENLPKTNARDFSEWVFEIAQEKKVRKNKVLEFENYIITILETKEGLATKIEIEINTNIEKED